MHPAATAPTPQLTGLTGAEIQSGPRQQIVSPVTSLYAAGSAFPSAEGLARHEALTGWLLQHLQQQWQVSAGAIRLSTTRSC